MSVDRVATASQTAYFLNQIENAGSSLDTTQQQIASGYNATTYAGFGDQTQVLTATLAANARNSAYTTATSLATTQVSLRTGITHENWEFNLFVDNLFDAHPQLSLAHQDQFTELYTAETLRPRTIGLTASYRY